MRYWVWAGTGSQTPMYAGPWKCCLNERDVQINEISHLPWAEFCTHIQRLKPYDQNMIIFGDSIFKNVIKLK